MPDSKTNVEAFTGAATQTPSPVSAAAAPSLTLSSPLKFNDGGFFPGQDAHLPPPLHRRATSYTPISLENAKPYLELLLKINFADPDWSERKFDAEKNKIKNFLGRIISNDVTPAQQTTIQTGKTKLDGIKHTDAERNQRIKAILNVVLALVPAPEDKPAPKSRWCFCK